MRKLTYTVFIFCGLVACRTNSNENSIQNKDSLTAIENVSLENSSDDGEISLNDYRVKSIGSLDDTYEVTEECALLLQMPDVINDSLLKVNGEDYNEFTEDENSASLNAYDLLESAKIKTLATPKRFIRYIYRNDTLIFDTQKAKSKLSGYYIFFKNDKQPEIYDCVMVDEKVIEKYYKN